MLRQFFIILFTLIILLIIFIIIKIAVPMWRFMIRADAVTNLYKIFNDLLQTEFQKEELIKISYGKYKLKFSNTNEASIEFEKLIKEALEYYEKLGWITIVDDSFKVQKNELIKICTEVRYTRWKKQKI